MSSEDGRGLPIWAVVAVIVLCLAGGGGFVWWFLSGSSASVAVQPVKPKTTVSQAVFEQFVEAVRKDDRAKLDDLMSAHPELPKSRDREGATLLHYAAWENKPQALTLLLDKGAELEARDAEHDGTPLGWACFGGAPASVEALLGRGAKADAGMLEMTFQGVAGNMPPFCPGKPEDWANIVELLQAHGVKSERMGELGLLKALRRADVRVEQAEGVRAVAGPPSAAAEHALLREMVAFCDAAWTADGIELRDERHNQGLVSKDVYAVPVKITARVKTDSTNIRLMYGAGVIILNWEVKQDQLRFHDPVTGRNQGIEGAGRVTPDEWHTVVWTISPTETVLTVDGEERLRREGEWKDVKGRVGVGPAWKSTVTVGALTVEPG